jgi:hypothetical protein
MMKQVFFSCFFSLGVVALFGQYNCQQSKQLMDVQSATPPINNNGKSDTLDILHYDLNLDFTRVQNGLLRGVCTITLTPKINGVSTVNLDLLALQVDSMTLNDTIHPSYTYNGGPQFPIILPGAANVGDTLTLAVYYHGSPIEDLSGWGGFHFKNPYFFNLGVGFAANPHTFGRTWFPCFDNFVEKSTYSFQVKTAGGRKAYCNGERTLLDTTSFGGDTVVSHWEQTDPIPTYLASVAISNYHEMRYTHAGKTFLLLGRTADTANISGSFANLPQIYDAQVASYGPYQWQKVGYAITTIGAMEHATSIHYPRNIVNGTLAFEDIIAHELAHHWFGNLVTCETAGDMWINEGMAEFVSHQYQELVYDRERYEEVVLANHDLVLNRAVIDDGGHFALYGLPNELTYGTHTYQKGAMVAHNLRTYLGDPAFYNGLQTLLLLNAYGTLNSYQFRDQLANITGSNLTSFFDDWIFNPGYPEFNIDSTRVFYTAIPEPRVNVGVSQRQFATTKPFTNVPLRITLRDSAGQTQHHEVLYRGGDTVFSLINAFEPQWANLNEGSYLLAGVSATDFDIANTGLYNNNYCKMDMTVQSLTDSADLRVEHHWAGPSRLGNEPFRISTSRYWRVSGYLPPGFLASGEVTFSSSAGNNFLDEDLLANGEDSLMLVYRKDAREPWREYDWYSKNYMGSPNNKFGRINIQVLIPGEYAFANGVSAFGLDEEQLKYDLKVYPNPASDSINILFNTLTKNQHWTIINSNGQQIARGKIRKGETEFGYQTSDLAAGIYFFLLDDESVPFVVQ